MNVWVCVCVCECLLLFFFFFKQKTAYEMRISDWSSDVCSSDLAVMRRLADLIAAPPKGRLSPRGRLHLGLAERLKDRGEDAGAAEAGLHDLGFRPVVVDESVGQRHRAEQIGRASCRERVCQYV